MNGGVLLQVQDEARHQQPSVSHIEERATRHAGYLPGVQYQGFQNRKGIGYSLAGGTRRRSDGKIIRLGGACGAPPWVAYGAAKTQGASA